MNPKKLIENTIQSSTKEIGTLLNEVNDQLDQMIKELKAIRVILENERTAKGNQGEDSRNNNDDPHNSSLDMARN